MTALRSWIELSTISEKSKTVKIIRIVTMIMKLIIVTPYSGQQIIMSDHS